MNVSSSMAGYIKEANTQLEIVTHEMASGEKKSLSTAEYQTKLRLSDDIGAYEKINQDLTLSKVENQVSDKVMSEMKDVVTSFKSKMILANTATTSDTDRDIIAEELRHYKDSIIDMANTEVMDNSLFSGADKSVKPFSTKTVDGHYTEVIYMGASKHFTQEIGKGISKGQGLTGIELFNGLVDSNGNLKYDEKGQKVLSVDSDTGKKTYEYQLDENGNPTTNVIMFDPTTQESGLQPKILYELDQAIEAIDNNEIVETNGRSIGSSLESVSDNVFEHLNVQHANLGNKNAIFEKVFEQNEYKLHSLDKLLQETEGIDIAEASIKLQQLQLMFASIFSTLQEVNQIEQRLAEST